MTVDLPRSYDPSHQNALLAMEALLGHDDLDTSACDDPFPPDAGRHRQRQPRVDVRAVVGPTRPWCN